MSTPPFPPCPRPQVNRFFQADGPGQMFFEHRLGPAPDAPLPTANLQASDTHGTRRMSAIRARRASVGIRRFSGLGMHLPSESESHEGINEAAPGSTVGGTEGGDLEAEAEASGHFYAGFGEGLTTKSPVVYFAKMKYTGGDDCKAPIDPHKVSAIPQQLFGLASLWCQRSSIVVQVLESARISSETISGRYSGGPGGRKVNHMKSCRTCRVTLRSASCCWRGITNDIRSCVCYSFSNQVLYRAGRVPRKASLGKSTFFSQRWRCR